jgi:hypothetical protein
MLRPLDDVISSKVGDGDPCAMLVAEERIPMSLAHEPARRSPVAGPPPSSGVVGDQFSARRALVVAIGYGGLSGTLGLTAGIVLARLLVGAHGGATAMLVVVSTTAAVAFTAAALTGPLVRRIANDRILPHFPAAPPRGAVAAGGPHRKSLRLYLHRKPDH